MDKGLTLLEILISVSLVAIAVLAVAALQSSALRANRQARQVQTVTQLAETELERQRQVAHVASSAQLGQACLSRSPGYLSCTVNVYPCTYASARLSCFNGTTDASSLVAHQLNVVVASGDGTPFSLDTVVRQ